MYPVYCAYISKPLITHIMTWLKICQAAYASKWVCFSRRNTLSRNSHAYCLEHRNCSALQREPKELISNRVMGKLPRFSNCVSRKSTQAMFSYASVTSFFVPLLLCPMLNLFSLIGFTHAYRVYSLNWNLALSISLFHTLCRFYRRRLQLSTSVQYAIRIAEFAHNGRVSGNAEVTAAGVFVLRNQEHRKGSIDGRERALPVNWSSKYTNSIWIWRTERIRKKKIVARCLSIHWNVYSDISFHGNF